MASSMRRGRWTAAIAFAGLATTAGCGSSGEPSPQRAAATQPPADRLDLSVVAVTARIGGDREESAGVVLDADRGLILTTAHGVWGARSLKVATGIAVVHGRIVARDACDDLAVLETQPRLPGLVAIRPSAEADPPAGSPLVAVRRRAGLPSTTRPELDTRRVVLGAPPAPRVLPGVRAKGAIALDARGLPAEASGAPLLAADGRLAGIAQVVERRDRTVRAALPWATIAARIRELRPGGRAQYVGWRRHYRCSPALHRHTAARHPGFRRGDASLNAPVPATRLPGTEGVDR
jgi:S1-C subfamily serine protease